VSVDELERHVRMIEQMMEPGRQEARMEKKHRSVLVNCTVGRSDNRREEASVEERFPTKYHSHPYIRRHIHRHTDT